MTEKEKAKAYDEALKFAKIYHKQGDEDMKTMMETCFPELAESEDERIRKDMIDTIKKESKDFPSSVIAEKSHTWIAWLEKQSSEQKENATRDKIAEYLKKLILDQSQRGFPMLNYEGRIEEEVDFIVSIAKKELKKERQGEQKPADKVEPKFKVGDWVVFNNKHQSIYQVEKIEDGYYILRHTHGGTFRVCVLHDESLRLWTIQQDAKNGDILTVENMIFVYKTVLASHIVSYCKLVNNKFEFFNDARTCCDGNSNVHPATKEQRDALMKAMTDAGYTFDFEKKELKKIENKNPLLSDFFKAEYERGKADAQKPTWSEEDENKLSLLEALCDEQIKGTTFYSTMYREMHELKDWLKLLKDRVQPKQEWKQENTDNLTAFENAMMHIGSSFFGQNAGLDPNDTNEIKKQANILLELVSKQEWNEEDERIIKRIDSLLYSINENDFKDIHAWLKSLIPQKQCGYNPYKATVESIAEMCKHYNAAIYSGLKDFYDNVKVKCKEAIEYDKKYSQKQWRVNNN